MGSQDDKTSDASIKAMEELGRKIDGLSQKISDLTQALSGMQTTAKAAAPAAMPAQSGLSIAIIGVRGHGQNHIKAYNKLKDCYISYICDVDTKVGNAAADAIKKVTGFRPKTVQDYREMLKDPSVDAVVICTPHHWHVLCAIDALKAGKHVYIEKPITHHYSERWSLLAAAKKYNGIVQAGTQLRSNQSLAAAGEYMRSGQLGAIEMVHCIVHKDRPPVARSADAKVPATVDYKMWSGPAKIAALLRGAALAPPAG